MVTPHSILGVPPDASAEEIRSARRDLARRHHPDAGGDSADMQRINAAAALALRMLEAGDPPATREPTGTSPRRHDTAEEPPGWIGHSRDVPSFTVEALPVEAFEALLIAAAELGEVADDAPPYDLRVLLAPPQACWCQLDVVPDAGASTVSVSIAAAEGHPLPPLAQVRNAWIEVLNRLDWSDLG
ncbi:DnaJ domain-containing protein [Ilumatobacter nonamiensis]|uniref:DnaJ domain-containing protein n=1 Tax=Ilumatobacter nonamiensis TaxID=467093 RepID=UPI0006854906|nr:DnaJ domain-containing protein [Ilumatobacter nonamiensis]